MLNPFDIQTPAIISFQIGNDISIEKKNNKLIISFGRNFSVVSHDPYLVRGEIDCDTLLLCRALKQSDRK